MALAQALAPSPKALVLIYPTAGAGTGSRRSLHDSILAAASRGAAVLLVSDDLHELRICDRVLVMRHGWVALERPRGWSDAEILSAIEGVVEEVVE